MHRLTIETVGDTSRLICKCGRPFLVISDGKARFLNKHGSSQHENTLTLNELEIIIAALWRQLNPRYQRW